MIAPNVQESAPSNLLSGAKSVNINGSPVAAPAASVGSLSAVALINQFLQCMPLASG